MTRIIALLALALVGVVAAQSQSAKLIMPSATPYQMAENELTNTYKATLDTISELYRELGMDEQMNEAGSYRSKPGKVQATLSLAMRRMAGEELSVDEVNEAYSGNYRFNVGELVSGASLGKALELTSHLKDVKEQVGIILTAVQEVKSSAFGLTRNAWAVARLVPDSVNKMKTLVNKGIKIYKTVTSENGIKPLVAKLLAKKPAAEGPIAADSVPATPAQEVIEAIAVAENATVTAVPAVSAVTADQSDDSQEVTTPAAAPSNSTSV